LYNTSAKANEIKDIWKAKAVVGGMTDMLDIVGLNLTGWLHSGVDDSVNTAWVCLVLMQNGF